MKRSRKKVLSMGLELETYSISLPDNRICRELHFPKRSSIEKGERFTRDWSIGSEYNSRVTLTIREAFFLLKTGLRKYTEYRYPRRHNQRHVIFPIGGWTNRFAGGHLHLAFGEKRFSYEEALGLAKHIHDHIPFLIAICCNSPVWNSKLEDVDSNRLQRGTNRYCKVTPREMLYKSPFREMIYNRGGKKKPPTF